MIENQLPGSTPMNQHTHDLANNRANDRAALVDAFGRRITYLRLSVTDRCNLRCQYCMAEHMTFLPRSEVLSFDEVVTVARAFTRRGVRKLRLTGGEPLVRKQIVELARQLAALPGLDELVMTTNGLLLPTYAQALVAAGIRRINISIDSLRPDRYRAMTRWGDVEEVLAGIEAARTAGFERIKLNTVLMNGLNGDELLELARFAIERDLDIAFIEEMPLGHIDSHRRGDTYLSNLTVRERLLRELPLTPSTTRTGGPAQYWQVAGTQSLIGFISPHSENFCGECNRVRLTADGRLLTCLGNEHSADLRAVVRDHPSDEDALQNAISIAISHKPERHHFNPNETQIVRFMNATGG